MPPFMRINPVLDWSYGHIWHFLRLYQLPYCGLYDLGYTSLGKVGNTDRCPSLKKAGTEDEYWPAYMLVDWCKEREGREKKEVLEVRRGRGGMGGGKREGRQRWPVAVHQ